MHNLWIKVICTICILIITMAGSPIPEPLGQIAKVLLIIGGLNWGLAIVDTNLVGIIANATADVVGTLVYALVGLSAIISVVDLATGSK